MDVPELTPERVEQILKQLEEDARKAVKCSWCRRRCDPPYGDGKLCMSCASRPTAETMNMILR